MDPLDPQHLRLTWFVLGCICCVIGYGALWLSAVTVPHERARLVVAILVSVLLLGSTLVAQQPVSSMCGVCAKSIEPGSWAYWIYGCWAC